MTKREIIICRDVNQLNRKAAEHFVLLARQASVRAGRFTVALSGGSTPRALYSLLASRDYRERVEWSQVHFFWGDERCVAPDHAESNFRMVQEALLSKIEMPSENIHRMAGEFEPGQAAAAYETELKQFFRLPDGALPRLDLILLGLGEDGHTASLFPGGAALGETEDLVAAAYVEKLQAHRLTLTLPVINAAAQATFLISGQGKSAVVKEILGAESSSSIYPAAKVSPTDGQLTWLITADAAPALSAR